MSVEGLNCYFFLMVELYFAAVMRTKANFIMFQANFSAFRAIKNIMNYINIVYPPMEQTGHGNKLL